jgi:hypothetical protein
MGNVTFCLQTQAQSPRAGLSEETINPTSKFNNEVGMEKERNQCSTEQPYLQLQTNAIVLHL